MSTTNDSSSDTDFRLDAGAFWSAALGFGNLNKDKLETFEVGSRRRLNYQELFELYETNNFIANVVDTVPDDALQKYCKYESDAKPLGLISDNLVQRAIQSASIFKGFLPLKAYQKIVNFIKRLGHGSDKVQDELDRINPYINQAWKLARLVGWAAIVILVDDGELDYSQPVNVRNIKQISGYTVLKGGEAGEINVARYDEDPFSLTYGEPQLFNIAGSVAPVHVSRLLLFYGVKKLSHLGGRAATLGTSVVDRCYQEFRNFDVGNNAIASTLPDFNVDVFAIPGLMQLLAKQKEFASYISGMAFARSVLKVQLVEAGANGQNPGGYQIINRQYTGVKELLEFFKQIFAGATDINHTMLFGESPEGQTSGKYQLRSWAQYIDKQQQTNLRPELEKLINYLHAIQGQIPEDWSLEFPSILELDESEEADIQLKKAQKLKLLTDAQIATPDEAAKALADDVEIGKAIDLEAREQERQALQQFPEGMTVVNNM